MNICIVDAVESGDKQAIEDLNKAIDRFIKIKQIPVVRKPYPVKMNCPNTLFEV